MKKSIKKYENICNKIVKKFSKKQNIDFDYWIADHIGELASFIEQYTFSLQDMVFDLKSEQPVGLICQWIDDGCNYYQDNPDDSSFINYRSYAMGLRYSDLKDRKDKVKLHSNGLKCDNPQCDWKDEKIPVLEWGEWLNKGCPKCGENVLTENDFANAKLLIEVYEMLNTHTEEELAKITNELIENEGDNYQICKNKMGIGNLEDSDTLTVTFGTHGEITIESVAKD